MTLLTLVQYLMVTSLFGGLAVSVLQQKASSVSSLQSLCTFCTFSRGACTCGGGDVTCVRQLSSARPRVCVCVSRRRTTPKQSWLPSASVETGSSSPATPNS